jgi:RNA polymerase sigma factor (sigma-70 family)
MVYVVDDDPEVQDSVKYLMESVGLRVQTFSSARAFLESYRDQGPCCLVLDLRMPGMSGLEMQEQLRARSIEVPVIIVTGHGDVPAAVRAMKLGAVEFLEKPCNDHALLETVQRAIDADRRDRADRRRSEPIRQALATLSHRERDVLERIVSGNSNKEVARHLGLSPKTVERHRANIMRKIGAGSLAELVTKVTMAGPIAAGSGDPH